MSLISMSIGLIETGARLLVKILLYGASKTEGFNDNTN